MASIQPGWPAAGWQLVGLARRDSLRVLWALLELCWVLLKLSCAIVAPFYWFSGVWPGVALASCGVVLGSCSVDLESCGVALGSCVVAMGSWRLGSRAGAISDDVGTDFG